MRLVLLLVVAIAGCGRQSFRCVCTDEGHVRALELANAGTPAPGALPVRTAAELCAAACQANEVPKP